MGEKLSEALAIVASIPPAVAAIGTYNSDVVDMSKFRKAVCVIQTGTYGAAGATLNVQLYANTTNATSGGTAITGKAFTPATFSGSAAGQDKEGVIEVSGEEIEQALPGARYLYATATVATDTVAFSLAILAGEARYSPASDYDLSSVAEIVS